MSGLGAALWSEFQKARHSRILWLTAAIFGFLVLIAGLFMFILKDPELARRLGILGAKAQVFGGTADWPSFFNLLLVLVGVGGLVIFGFIFVWIFGREFSEKTVLDILSLPTSRVTIVTAKVITAIYWSVALVLLSLAMGAALQLPGWTGAAVLNGLEQMLASCGLTALLCIPFSLLASMMTMLTQFPLQ